MAWNEAVVTNSGLELLTRCVLGGSIEITSAVGGENVSPAVSLLAVKKIAGPNHLLQVAKIDRLENGVRVNVRAQNNGLSKGYRLRQIGIFAKTAGSEETPVLLALIQDKDGEEVPTEEENPEYLLEYDFVIPLSNTENISVSVTPDTFATLDDLEPMNRHIQDKDNPHGVTKAQVGLGNVPNVTTNDQTPTYTVSDALAELVSGEKLGTVLGKLAKAVKELIAHLADNVRHVTASERASWNEKANGTHGHSAGEISGLPSSLPANGGNADTVDGLHGWQLGTLDQNGNSFGTNFAVHCQYNLFNDDRFAFRVQDHGIRTDYATNAGNADTLQNIGFSNGQGSKGIVAVETDNGAIEIGPYIDFHDSEHVHSDYAVRLFADSQGVLHVHKDDGEQGLLTCDISGNADTVDGLHAWQHGTLNSSGYFPGTSDPFYCQHNFFGDGRFGFWVNGHETRVNYATGSDTATKLQTTRNINGVPFDGTQDITLPAYTNVPQPATFKAIDLNSSEFRKPFGFSAYHIDGESQTITNGIPGVAMRGCLINYDFVHGSWGIQYFQPYYGPIEYYRIYDNGNFGQWSSLRSNATQSASGLMSAADKTRLDALNGFTLKSVQDYSLGTSYVYPTFTVPSGAEYYFLIFKYVRPGKSDYMHFFSGLHKVGSQVGINTGEIGYSLFSAEGVANDSSNDYVNVTFASNVMKISAYKYSGSDLRICRSRSDTTVIIQAIFF